jgi:tetratricopeptide (TPR) repeat protein
MAKVDAGNLEPVLERAPALRREHEGHHGVQLALYKAETARAILNVAERLAQMERPEPENPDVPLPVNIARLEARMEYLNLLQGHYRDWREAILRIPAVRRVYEDYQEEIRQAPQQLVDWQAGYRFLQQAAAELQKPEPDFDLAMQFLRSAWGYLPLREILQTAQDAQNIAQARYMLDHRVVARAVEHLKAVDAEALKPPAAAEEGADDDGAAPETTTTLQTINSRLYEFWSQAKSKVGSWDELNTALAQARTDFREGRVDEALKTIKTALPKADPDNALTRDLAARLRRLQAHYREVQAAWRKALTVKAEKGLEEQLAAWAGFQGVLNRDDEYFQQALRQELLAIKETITGRIAERYRALRKAGEGYQSITLQMRKPQNPRQPFAEQARRLRAMALEAERIRNLAALVPNWDLGETTSAQVEEARSILGEHNDQARRLHNLYKLYHRLGKVELARESLQRVRLLGDVSSNPWYAEAVKTLEG